MYSPSQLIIFSIVKVLDRNQFTPGRPLGTGTLWVGEQIPALYVFADVTPQLERGYWPSYNVVSIEHS